MAKAEPIDERRGQAHAASGGGSGLFHSLKRLPYRFVLRASVPVDCVLGDRSGRGFGILTYHRVTPLIAATRSATMNVPPERFREQLTGLLSRGFEPWSLRDVLACHEADRPVPSRTFVVTFDDGFENVYQSAFPVLCELGVPATVFLATDYLDRNAPFPFDDWALAGSAHVPVESWHPLTTSQCKVMQATGLIELAAHTHTHVDFRGQPEALQSDLKKSIDVLEGHFGVEQPSFAFPYGSTRLGYAGGTLSEAARAAGVRCALSTDECLVAPGDDPFYWARFNAESGDTASTLAAKLNGWYGVARDTLRRACGGRVVRHQPVRPAIQPMSTSSLQ